jgi:hypothetical protein
MVQNFARARYHAFPWKRMLTNSRQKMSPETPCRAYSRGMTLAPQAVFSELERKPS